MLHSITITDAQLEKLDDGKRIDTYLEGRMVRIKKISSGILNRIYTGKKASKHVPEPTLA